MKSKFFIGLAATMLLSNPGFSQSLTVGKKAPDIHLEQMLQGHANEVITLNDLKGSVVVVDFWTTWCSPCIKAFSHINELVRTFEGEPVVFLAISNEEEVIVNSLLEKKVSLDAWIGLDTDLSVFKDYNAWAIPKTVVIDQDGKLVAIVHPAYLEHDLIRDLLSGKQMDIKVHTEDPYHDLEGAESHFRKMGSRETRN